MPSRSIRVACSSTWICPASSTSRMMAIICCTAVLTIFHILRVNTSFVESIYNNADNSKDDQVTQTFPFVLTVLRVVVVSIGILMVICLAVLTSLTISACLCELQGVLETTTTRQDVGIIRVIITLTYHIY